jgi:hypothetical protein
MRAPVAFVQGASNACTGGVRSGSKQCKKISLLLPTLLFKVQPS